MTPFKFAQYALIVACALAATAHGTLAVEPPAKEVPPMVVDYRYSPIWWQTSICLPDDWQKTLVGKEGTLLYDFPGTYSGFKTRIAFTLGEGEKWVRQELVSPRTPIVQTVKRRGAVEATEEAFAVAPPIHVPETKKVEPPIVQRVDGDGGQRDWAHPTIACNPAFRDVAIGWNSPIRYRIRAAGKGPYTVVFGLCEGWQEKPAQRILNLKIEGKIRKSVDMIAQYGKNVPAVFPFEARDEDGDGWIDVEVAAATESVDQNTILNLLWVFPGTAPPASELIAGSGNGSALATVHCGLATGHVGPPRQDVVLVHLHNTDTVEASIAPAVVIQSELPVTVDIAGMRAKIGEDTTFFSPSAFTMAEQSKGKTLLQWPKLPLKAGEEKLITLGVLRGVRSPERAQLFPGGSNDLASLRPAAETYWRNVDLPYGRIEVPDARIQGQLDASIRNIYQAREIKKGLPAFQVGPTCYRGLWVVDGSFLMESVAFLGRTEEARNGIRYLLSFQRDDGAIMIMNGHWKETGIALWAVTRHARLTGDQAWLREVWPKLERGWDYIRSMRKAASADPNSLCYGLIPAGFADGGMSGTQPEYTNVYWTLAGLKAALEAARWLGKTEEAQRWQLEYDDFYAAFRRAAQRDVRIDRQGNRYVPICMRKDQTFSPQKAQWGFMHAVFPGKLFAVDDPLVRGNMAMLRAAECEGLVRDTGWVSEGIWNYFASFYAHDWLWLGDGQKAARTLYAFANHASPLLCWREEQMPAGKGDATCGDMPHNWASAEFIRLVRHLLVLERGSELHLFEGLPRIWIRPGSSVRVQGVLTEFGPISLELRTALDGSKATLTLDPPRRDPPRRILVHLDGWSGSRGTLEMPLVKAVREIPLTSGK
ncbi:MAG: hypothetical protein ACLQNE_15150 [Thermoguttaceae bacterium]